MRALFFSAVILVSWHLSASGQDLNKPSDKIYSVITQTVEMMKSDGIDLKNVARLNVSKKYNSLMTMFDGAGRFGLNIDFNEIPPGVTSRLVSEGCDILLVVDGTKTVSAFVPIEMIGEIARWPEVKIIRPIMGGVASTGSVTSEGDSIHHAREVRNELYVTGEGVNVGVISDGCTNWAASQATGDLPAAFGPPNYSFGLPPVLKNGSGDEGTAMMEIVHDLSPSSALYFYGALGGGSAAMIDAIQRLTREKGCDVIVDDITFFDQPMFEDATPATANTIAAWAKWANDTGVVYVSSAGNWAAGGFTDRSHYQGYYADVDPANNTPGLKPLPNGPIPLPPPPQPPPNLFDDLHDFDAGPGFDPGLRVIIPAYSGTGEPPKLYFILEWADPSLIMPDPWGASADDYDLYLYDNSLTARKASSTGAQAGAQNPYESIWYFNYYPYPETLNVVIEHFAPAAIAKLLGLYIYGCAHVEYNTPSNSIWGQPGVPEVLAVGAVPANNINQIETFSSRGNYNVYVPAFQGRDKPDLVAVDKVSITGAGGFPPWGGPFGGTSAAAPHVAAMASLILSKYPALTPAEIHSKLERTATDLGDPLFDPVYGNGRADAELALMEVDTAEGSNGPYTISSTVGAPMFFGTAAGYASNTIMITGGASPPGTVSSTVNVTSGNPYVDAGISDPGYPTVRRWYQFTQSSGVSGMYSADITAYIDESERLLAGIDQENLGIIHWNGNYFDPIPELAPPEKIGNTWKVTGRDTTADFSPFFIGHLVRGIILDPPADSSGMNDSTVTFNYSVTNSGNGWDTISIRISDLKGWPITGGDTSFSLGGGVEAHLEFSVTIPPSDPAGTKDTLTVAARLVSDSSFTQSASTTLEITLGETRYNGEMLSGWNMLSLPLRVSDRRKEALYPTSISGAFGYDGSYRVADTIEYGYGYWVKFDSAESVGISGFRFESDTIAVIDKWNMIGCGSEPMPVDSISSEPGGIITSNFFGFDGSAYIAVDSLKPGSGYWVKVREPGSLITGPGSSMPASSRIRIMPIPEMPPGPPEGDGIDAKRIVIPERFALEQNYPNPFNPVTSVAYHLPVGLRVVIRIYSLLGQEVMTLLDGFETAGAHEVTFDASGLTSGIYYCRMTAGVFVETKKIILMK